MSKFKFVRESDEAVFEINTDKQHLLLLATANKQVDYSDVCAIDSNNDYVDELYGYETCLPHFSFYTDSDTVLMYLSDVGDISTQAINALRATSCHCVFYGENCGALPDDVLSKCFRVSEFVDKEMEVV
ncbi:MAG: hypothetical protein NC548_11260 [Lachnospiraceae bacterium]|nr:hypothetical protein [Lachnospiraceae bacterium]MCM1235612.1 hypothetical protein [Ruminococcus flavefaciens]